MVALAAFIIESNQSFARVPVEQAVFVTMVCRRYGMRNRPNPYLKD